MARTLAFCQLFLFLIPVGSNEIILERNKKIGQECLVPELKLFFRFLYGICWYNEEVIEKIFRNTRDGNFQHIVEDEATIKANFRQI